MLVPNVSLVFDALTEAEFEEEDTESVKQTLAGIILRFSEVLASLGTMVSVTKIT
jgi:hypothetical protein